MSKSAGGIGYLIIGGVLCIASVVLNNIPLAITGASFIILSGELADTFVVNKK